MTAVPPLQHSPARAWWTLAVLTLGGLVSYMHRLVLGSLVDPLSHDLHIDDAQLSLLQGAAFAVVYVLAGLPLGRLADRGPRRLLLVGGATIWCTGTLICGFAPTFTTLFAGRLIVGLGEAALAPAAASIIGASFPPERRGTAFGIFLMGMAVGGPGAITVGGLLLGAAQSGAFVGWPLLDGLAPWRCVLLIMGASGLIVPLLALTVREPARHDVEVAMPIREVLRWGRGARWLILLLLAVALLSVGDYGLLSWVPATLSRGFDWSPVRVGAAFGVVTTLAGITGPLIGGFLSDQAAKRGGERARFLLIAVTALAAVIGAALVAAPSAEGVLAGLGLWTFLSAAASTMGIAAMQALVPTTLRGTTMSLVAFCNTLLGLGLGPTAVALLTGHLYGTPESVGFSIATVVVPAAILSALLTMLARQALREWKGAARSA